MCKRKWKRLNVIKIIYFNNFKKAKQQKLCNNWQTEENEIFKWKISKQRKTLENSKDSTTLLKILNYP